MGHHDDQASRRTFLKAGVGMMSAIGMSSAPLEAEGSPRPDPPRPNFIFLLGEGHRPDALSLNGNKILQTPNFDRIGREGVQFRNSFTVNALCLPARSSALTGLHPQHGLRGQQKPNDSAGDSTFHRVAAEFRL